MITTLTLNPTIDGASETESVRPTHKIRTSNERFSPGGGGINVARVLARLGARVRACYMAGGQTGAMLNELIARDALPRSMIPIVGDTRLCHAVYERATGEEYRFVPEGPVVGEEEWRSALDHVAGLECGILVASGSLPRGVPEDFMARLVPLLRARGTRMILDSSGPALAAAVRAGGLWMIKPSRSEFAALIDRQPDDPALTDPDRIGDAARDFVRQGAADLVIVTLGEEGAVFADAERHFHRAAPVVPVRSAVGAGDSFVAGMTHRLAQGWAPERAFLYGMAAGTAAVLTPGTSLCEVEDVERLFARIERED